jgi:hypothetical protein
VRIERFGQLIISIEHLDAVADQRIDILKRFIRTAPLDAGSHRSRHKMPPSNILP